MNIPYILSENSLTIFLDGKPHTLRKDHPNFNLARKAILDGETEKLADLVDVQRAVEDFVQGDIEVKDEIVYYKGHRLHGVVVDKLLEMLRAGLKDSAPITNFIARLQANPSANSVAELYTFLGYKSLPTTAEGKVLGYKGVQHDYWSTTGNADTIVVQGETNERHQILNSLGSTIEVARRCVDDNKDNHCSFGLHVGSYDYANDWAGENGRLLVVEFDPADAVSVPTDCNFQKLRVSKYKVVGDITDTREEMNKPIYEANKPIYGSDADDDYIDDDDYDDDFVDQGDWVEDDDDDGDEDLASDFVDVDIDMDSLDKDKPTRDQLKLDLVRYMNKKMSKGQEVTLKHLADLTLPRELNMKCSDLMGLMTELGYKVEEDESIPLYLHKVTH
jgi:hypothetical protein